MAEASPEVPSEILKAAATGHLVVFVGAGVSRIIGCPSWKDLALKWLKHLFEHKAIDFYEMEKLQSLDARRLLTLCEIIHRENETIPKPDIKELIRGSEALIAKYPIYEDLYSFNAVFVTTNYDDYLDLAAKKSLPPPAAAEPTGTDTTPPPSADSKVYYSNKDLLLSKLDGGSILHLHGSLQDRGSMIVTVADYMRHYSQGSAAQVLLKEIFQGSYTVLFVGYGLDELEILEFLVRGAAPKGKDEIQHFMLYPYFGEEQRLLKHHENYYRSLGVKLLPFPIGVNGYEQLCAIVREWAKVIGPVARSQDYLDKRKLIDEVA